MTRTPTELEALEAVIKRFIVDLHTVAVGVVESYDPDTRRAKIQHGIKREFTNGEIRPIEPIDSVPVVFPAGGGLRISWQVQKGDELVILFCERSLDTWLQKSGVVDPDKYRMHDETDAIAIPTLMSAANAIAASDDGLLIENDAGVEVRISNGGNISIETGNSSALLNPDGSANVENEAGAYVKIAAGGGMDAGNNAGSILQLISDLTTATSTATVPTAIGPQLLVQPQFPVILATATAIKGDS